MNIRKLTEQLEKILDESYEPGDSIYLTFNRIDGNQYELDGVEFYKGEDEDLQNSVEVCIEEEYLPGWQAENEEVTGYWIQSFDYDEDSESGEVEVVLK